MLQRLPHLSAESGELLVDPVETPLAQFGKRKVARRAGGGCLPGDRRIAHLSENDRLGRWRDLLDSPYQLEPATALPALPVIGDEEIAHQRERDPARGHGSGQTDTLDCRPRRF